jgi:hypothetical protein
VWKGDTDIQRNNLGWDDQMVELDLQPCKTKLRIDDVKDLKSYDVAVYKGVIT